MYDKLARAIDDRTAKIVVIGLGYVGLPVACLFAEAGFQVTGVDRLETRVAAINRSASPIEGYEPGLAELLSAVVASQRFRATTDYAVCRDALIILIAVETPVENGAHKPAYVALRAVLRDLGPHLGDGALVIVESTLAPRTMECIVAPDLERSTGKRAGRDFDLVHCPERLMPGKLLHNIRTMHRVVGGATPQAADAAARLYRCIVQGDLDSTDCLTAEIVKTAENAYRDVQIAFANELALICEDLGADVWKTRELINKSPGRNVLYPGAGVGGHCIPKDPWLLIANTSASLPLRLIPAARAINDSMPYHVADLVVSALMEAGAPIEGAKVAVLGYAYLENSDDVRNTPTEPLVQRLRELGARVAIHDPYVAAYATPLDEIVNDAQCLVLMVRHDEYQALDWPRLATRMAIPIIVDGRHAFPAIEGWDAYGVGRQPERRNESRVFHGKH